jgi:replicative DNA helicase
MSHQLARKQEPKPINGRVPPHDLDAEAAVLGAILLSEDAIDGVIGTLKPEHFYSNANGLIYRAALELSEAGTQVDVLTITRWLRDRERLAQVGGIGYVSQLHDCTPAFHHLASHAEIVVKKSRVRQLIATCQRVAAEGYGDVGDEEEFLVDAEARVHDVAHDERKQTTQHLGSILGQVFNNIQNDCNSELGTRIPGVHTGYQKLDQKMCGWRDGDLYIVAARPAMGKTAWIMNIAVNVASPRTVNGIGIHGDGAVVFSLEMPRDQIGERLLGSESRVPISRIRSRNIQPADWSALTEASVFLSSLPIWIDDTPAISLMELRAKVRQVQAQWDRPAKDGAPERRMRLVIVDYLQLMKGRDGAKSREQEISEISRGLKQLAKELKVPVVALSQLNRAVETRSTKDKRPQLSDLRESGAIEQDADAVMLLYRDEYYYPETTKSKNIAEVIIAKQRNGPPGSVFLRFDGECTRFDNLAPGEYQEAADY